MIHRDIGICICTGGLALIHIHTNKRTCTQRERDWEESKRETFIEKKKRGGNDEWEEEIWKGQCNTIWERERERETDRLRTK